MVFLAVEEERSDTVETHPMMSDAWDHPSLREINTLGLKSNEQVRREYCDMDEQQAPSSTDADVTLNVNEKIHQIGTNACIML